MLVWHISKLELNINTERDENFVTHRSIKLQYEDNIIAQDFKRVIIHNYAFMQ